MTSDVRWYLLVTLLSLFYIVSLSSCGSEDFHYTRTCTNEFYNLDFVSPTLSEEDKVALRDAAETWNGFQQQITIEEGGDGLKIVPVFVDILPYCNGSCDAVASPQEDGCGIVVRRGAPNLRRVLLHEIGHCLGLGHSDSIYSLMHPSPRALDLTEDMEEQLSNLPYCE